MKHTLAAATLAAIAAITSVSAQAADSGTLNVTGSLTQSSCQIDPIQTGGLTVKLDKLSTAVLQAANSTAGEKEFGFKITGGTNCAQDLGVSLRFDGANIDPATGALNSTTPNKSVKVQFVNLQNQVIDLYQNTNIPREVMGATGTSVQLKMKARYLAPEANTAAAGDIATAVNFAVTYE